jgi:hypothetical protein
MKYWSGELREAASGCVRCEGKGREGKGRDNLIQYKQLLIVPVCTVAELRGLN